MAGTASPQRSAASQGDVRGSPLSLEFGGSHSKICMGGTQPEGLGTFAKVKTHTSA